MNLSVTSQIQDKKNVIRMLIYEIMHNRLLYGVQLTDLGNVLYLAKDLPCICSVFLNTFYGKTFNGENFCNFIIFTQLQNFCCQSAIQVSTNVLLQKSAIFLSNLKFFSIYGIRKDYMQKKLKCNQV